MNWSENHTSAAFSKYQWFKYQCRRNAKQFKYKAWISMEWAVNIKLWWDSSTFKRSRNYYQLFKDIANTDANYSLDTISLKPTIDRIANEIANMLLYQASVESILEILDCVTNHPAMPKALRGFPIGHYVRVVMSINSCYNKFKK